MNGFPEILTFGNIRLRPARRSDLPEISGQLNDPDTARWMAAIAQPFGADDAEALFRHSEDPAERVRVIEIGSELAGCLCLGTGLWYWLAPDHRGRGVMYESLRGAIEAHFREPAPPLVATCREDNTASLKLLGRLGFSALPSTRRMFFRSTGSSHACRDHAMTPEQWHFINPPRIESSGVTLRPAGQKDAALLGQLLPGIGRTSRTWDAGASLEPRAFIERHRYRGGGAGLFVVESDDRRSVGFALLREDLPDPLTIFLSDQDERRYGHLVRAGFGRPSETARTVHSVPAPDPES